MVSEWKKARLSDMIDLIGGGTPSRNNPEFWNGNIPWLSIKDFNNEYRFVSNSQESITQLGLDKSRIKLLLPGQVIISARGTIGAITQLKKKMAFNQSCYGISAKHSSLTNDYLYYLLKHSIYNLQQLAHGAVFDTITRETFDHINVKIPPVTEQNRITQILGAFDNKIELNRQMNKTLEAIAHTLFQSWFVDFDPVIDKALNSGKEIPKQLQEKAARREALGNQRKSLPFEIESIFPDEFVESEFGWTPKGWKNGRLSDIAEINPFEKIPKDRIAPYIPMKALPKLGTSISFIVNKLFSSGSKFRNGDVLLARISPCLENGKTGLVDGFHRDQVGHGSTEFIVLRSLHKKASGLIYLIARNKKFREYCINNMNGSSGRQRVAASQVALYSMPIPSIELIHYFSSLTADLFLKIENLNKENRILIIIRDILLPKLISGEIRISEAEVIIERALNV